ncbi:pan domain protein [Cystoisospora suis]|uniref:Pan domain protein n=1 Tax=Cystoisospora suis TaxID=483139 RepID=A0A2C6KXQ4_9APIC|nr:pan domain protein [Cystoisospora suis]
MEAGELGGPSPTLALWGLPQCIRRVCPRPKQLSRIFMTVTALMSPLLCHSVGDNSLSKIVHDDFPDRPWTDFKRTPPSDQHVAGPAFGQFLSPTTRARVNARELARQVIVDLESRGVTLKVKDISRVLPSILPQIETLGLDSTEFENELRKMVSRDQAEETLLKGQQHHTKEADELLQELEQLRQEKRLKSQQGRWSGVQSYSLPAIPRQAIKPDGAVNDVLTKEFEQQQRLRNLPQGGASEFREDSEEQYIPKSRVPEKSKSATPFSLIRPLTTPTSENAANVFDGNEFRAAAFPTARTTKRYPPQEATGNTNSKASFHAPFYRTGTPTNADVPSLALAQEAGEMEGQQLLRMWLDAATGKQSALSKDLDFSVGGDELLRMRTSLDYTSMYPLPCNPPLTVLPLVAASFDAWGESALALLQAFDGNPNEVRTMFADAVLGAIPWRLKNKWKVSERDVRLFSIQDKDITIYFNKTHVVHRPEPNSWPLLQSPGCEAARPTNIRGNSTEILSQSSCVRVQWDLLDSDNRGQLGTTDMVRAVNDDLMRKSGMSHILGEGSYFGRRAGTVLSDVLRVAMSKYSISGLVVEDQQQCSSTTTVRPATSTATSTASPGASTSTATPSTTTTTAVALTSTSSDPSASPPPPPVSTTTPPPTTQSSATSTAYTSTSSQLDNDGIGGSRPTRMDTAPPGVIGGSGFTTAPATPGPPVPEGPDAVACYSVGVDYFGFDIAKIERGDIESAGECAEHCRVHSGCYYWTFNPTRRWCYLKNVNAPQGLHRDPQTTSTLISGLKGCNLVDDPYPSEPCYQMDADILTTDGGYRSLKDWPSAIECHSSCTMDPRCFYWTYDTKDKKCYLKGRHLSRVSKGSAAGEPSSTFGLISGAKRCKGETVIDRNVRRLMEIDEFDAPTLMAELARTRNKWMPAPFDCGFEEGDLQPEDADILWEGAVTNPSACRTRCVQQAVEAVFSNVFRGEEESEEVEEECLFWRFNWGSGSCELINENGWRTWVKKKEGDTVGHSTSPVLVGSHRCRRFSANFPPSSPLDLCYQANVEFDTSARHLLREVGGVSEPNQCDLLCAAQSGCTSWTFRANERLCELLHSDAHTEKRVVDSAVRAAGIHTETVITALFGARPCIETSAGSVQTETGDNVDDRKHRDTSAKPTPQATPKRDQTTGEPPAPSIQPTESAGEVGHESPQQSPDITRSDSPPSLPTKRLNPLSTAVEEGLTSPGTDENSASPDVREGSAPSWVTSKEMDARPDGNESDVDRGQRSDAKLSKPSLNSRSTTAPSAASALVHEQKVTEAALFNSTSGHTGGPSTDTSAPQPTTVPALLVSMQPSPDGHLPPCARAGVSYEGHDLQPLSTAPLLGSARECWSLCVDVPLCYYWSFDSASGRCLLKDANAPLDVLRARPMSFVSGPRSCPVSADPKQFLPLLHRRPIVAPEDDPQTRPFPALKIGSTFPARGVPGGLLGIGGASSRDNGEKTKAPERTATVSDDGDNPANGSYGFWGGLSPGLISGWGRTAEKDSSPDLGSFLSAWLPLGGARSTSGDGFLARGDKNTIGKNVPGEDQGPLSKRTEGHATTSLVPSRGSPRSGTSLTFEDETEFPLEPTQAGDYEEHHGEARESSWLCQHEGVALTGGDLLLVGSRSDKSASHGMFSESPQSCAAHCADSLGCMFWTFDRENGLCYLKSWVAIQSYKSDESTKHFVSGPVTVTPDCFGTAVPASAAEGST